MTGKFSVSTVPSAPTKVLWHECYSARSVRGIADVLVWRQIRTQTPSLLRIEACCSQRRADVRRRALPRCKSQSWAKSKSSAFLYVFVSFQRVRKWVFCESVHGWPLLRPRLCAGITAVLCRTLKTGRHKSARWKSMSADCVGCEHFQHFATLSSRAALYTWATAERIGDVSPEFGAGSSGQIVHKDYPKSGVLIKRWLKPRFHFDTIYRFDCDSTSVGLPFDCSSIALRPFDNLRYD